MKLDVLHAFRDLVIGLIALVLVKQFVLVR